VQHSQGRRHLAVQVRRLRWEGWELWELGWRSQLCLRVRWRRRRPGHALLGMLRAGRGLVGRGFALLGPGLGLAVRELGSCFAVRLFGRWLVGSGVGQGGLRWLRG